MSTDENSPIVIEKKEPVSMDNSANGPASTDSGTESADFNSNNTQPTTTQLVSPNATTGANNNIQEAVQSTMQPILPGQATTAETPLVAQGPLIQG